MEPTTSLKGVARKSVKQRPVLYPFFGFWAMGHDFTCLWKVYSAGNCAGSGVGLKVQGPWLGLPRPPKIRPPRTIWEFV